MAETWKPIPGFDNYQVSDQGNVMSFAFHTPRLMKQSVNVNGYSFLGLSRGGKTVHCLVHRLVMLAFEGESGLLVNHKNLNKADNRLENLEYVTPAENTAHYIREMRPSRVLPCRFCGELKPDELVVFKQGRRTTLCKACSAKYHREYTKCRSRPAELACATCSEIKPIGEFSPGQYSCRACKNAKCRAAASKTAEPADRDAKRHEVEPAERPKPIKPAPPADVPLPTKQSSLCRCGRYPKTRGEDACLRCLR